MQKLHHFTEMLSTGFIRNGGECVQACVCFCFNLNGIYYAYVHNRSCTTALKIKYTHSIERVMCAR